MDDLSGLTLANSYLIECQIGAGGAATVYRGQNLQAPDAGRAVAIKIMFLDPDDRRNLSFALREAYEYSRLSHRGIPEFLDFGKLDHGWYYLVMDYVQGESLRSYVRRNGPIPEGAACVLVAEILDTLAYLQRHELVHRDVKPENVLLNVDGDAILVDFGMVKRRQDNSITFRNEEIKGTPGFLSPEQLRADPDLDVRSDVFSLGCTLYFCVTGIDPFRRDTPFASVGAVLSEEAPPFAANGADVSEEFTELVGRMLDKDYHQRPWPTDLREDFLNLSQFR